MENDGALSFEEMDGYAPDIPYDDLSDIFDLADENDNNHLIGAEFDGYIHHVEKYYKDLEKQKKDKKEKSSQTSSKSNPSSQDEGHETCPVCGSDQLSEFYNSEYGEMDWECDNCGEIIRDEDYLYINYWEQHGINCILHILERDLAAT